MDDYAEQVVDGQVNALSKRVIGAAIEVHRELGPGLSESIYERALCAELSRREIPFVCQHSFAVTYKGDEVGTFRVDLLVAGCLVVEIKSVELLTQLHKSQLITYLRAGRSPLGLPINFNVPVLKDGLKRLVP